MSYLTENQTAVAGAIATRSLLWGGRRFFYRKGEIVVRTVLQMHSDTL